MSTSRPRPESGFRGERHGTAPSDFQLSSSSSVWLLGVGRDGLSSDIGALSSQPLTSPRGEKAEGQRLSEGSLWGALVPPCPRDLNTGRKRQEGINDAPAHGRQQPCLPRVHLRTSLLRFHISSLLWLMAVTATGRSQRGVWGSVTFNPQLCVPAPVVFLFIRPSFLFGVRMRAPGPGLSRLPLP